MSEIKVSDWKTNLTPRELRDHRLVLVLTKSEREALNRASQQAGVTHARLIRAILEQSGVFGA